MDLITFMKTGKTGIDVDGEIFDIPTDFTAKMTVRCCDNVKPILVVFHRDN